MKSKSKIKIMCYFFIGIFIINTALISNSIQVKGKDPYFTILSYITWPYLFTEYNALIKEQLAKIGINLEVIYHDTPPDLFDLLLWQRGMEYIVVFGLDMEKYNPNLLTFFSENGSFNTFGYHTDMDWDEKLGTGKNQWYIEQLRAVIPPDSDERISLFREWENYQMDTILSVLPLTNSKKYSIYWDNLNRYNFTEGLLQSWGKMSWDGTHLGQNNISEIVTSRTQWNELNPLFQHKYYNNIYSNQFFSSLSIDPLFWLDSDFSIKPHLAKSYSMINSTHVRISLREGIKWQSDIDGNFTNEYFDAEDVYFTLSMLNHSSTASSNRISWLKEMEIIDPYTIDLFIDGWSPSLEKKEHMQFLEGLCKPILPEHYLNQSQDELERPDITHPSWEIYSENCFGTGLFDLTSYYTDFETILNVNPDCWWLNSTITDDPFLDWENRFGTFASNITQLRVDIHSNDLEALYFLEEGFIDISPDLTKKPKSVIGTTIQEKMSLFTAFLGYNLRNVGNHIIGNREPCKNDPSITKGLAVRKAIAYANDKVELNQIVHIKEHYIAYHPFFEARTYWNNPNIIRYNHDLEKAKYYLELAGFSTVISGFDIFDAIQLSFSVLVLILVIKRKQRMRK